MVIPTYNEKENINDFINEICNFDVSILIVDDNSPDGTGEIVKKLSTLSEQVNLLSRNTKKGLGSAYRDGFKWGIEKQYQYFIEMDADYSHRFKDLEQVLAESRFHDVVIGSRYIKGGGSSGWDFKRKLLSKTANKISQIFLKSNVNDMTSGFRSYSSEALNEINYFSTKSDGYSFQIELNFKLWAMGKKIKEVPIIFTERRDGQSKMSGGIVKEAVFAVIFLRLRKIFNRL